MNPVAAFFEQNIIAVFFFYGLAFFSMGLGLVLAGRQTSAFRLARAIYPLALFGILHGVNEWMLMLSLIAKLGGVYIPLLAHDALRLGMLVLSFLMLFLFGLLLLLPERVGWRQLYTPAIVLVSLWTLSVLLASRRHALPALNALLVGDVLARYLLAIPAALLSSWALFKQREAFRQHGMPQFGRDLLICAAALFGYGVIGQFFVRRTFLFPSSVINDALFLQVFGVPVQLFRAIMGAVVAFFMVHALNAFEVENRRRLQAANQARLQAQAAAIEAERRIIQEKERLNEQLRRKAHELGLLLEVSNLLATPVSLPGQARRALQRIVTSLKFSDAGMILLVERETGNLRVAASVGFGGGGVEGAENESAAPVLSLGEKVIASGKLICCHRDGHRIALPLEEALQQQSCRSHPSPVTMVGLPLITHQQITGSIVLARLDMARTQAFSFNEFQLMVGVSQQLGLFLENARLQQEAQRREAMLAELLHQVVGAQEAERQRIARELHDATGQSLSAIGMGLRGVEAMLQSNPTLAIRQVRELKSFSGRALGELRHIIADLRPSQLDDLGLVAALQWYIQQFEERYAVPTRLVVQGEPARLRSEYETVLFRITQEALTNVARHARATQATVELAFFPAQIILTITDNGRGFEPHKTLWPGKRATGWGLLGMQERATLVGGEWRVNSAPGEGTQIQVRIPLVGKQKDGKNTVAIG